MRHARRLRAVRHLDGRRRPVVEQTNTSPLQTKPQNAPSLDSRASRHGSPAAGCPWRRRRRARRARRRARADGDEAARALRHEHYAALGRPTVLGHAGVQHPQPLAPQLLLGRVRRLVGAIVRQQLRHRPRREVEAVQLLRRRAGRRRQVRDRRVARRKRERFGRVDHPDGRAARVLCNVLQRDGGRWRWWKAAAAPEEGNGGGGGRGADGDEGEAFALLERFEERGRILHLHTEQFDEFCRVEHLHTHRFDERSRVLGERGGIYTERLEERGRVVAQRGRELRGRRWLGHHELAARLARVELDDARVVAEESPSSSPLSPASRRDAVQRIENDARA